MSLSFPNLALPACVGWNFAKRSKYSSILQTPQSMRHPASATLQTSVIYELELTYEFLMNAGLTYADDLAYLQAFYEACRGGFGWFTFDPSQYSLDTMSVVHDTTALRNGFFAVGDGVTRSFPLWRSTSALGPGVVTPCELIQYVPFSPGIYSNGTLVSPSAYTLSSFPAQVTFASAPANGAVLAWDGSYSYLCRFAEEVFDAEEFMYQLWELKSLKLETINL
jgi:hypothetical protein